MTPSICVAVLTCRRPGPLRALLCDIRERATQFAGQVAVRVYDDATPVPEFCGLGGVRYMRSAVRHGKHYHWHWMRCIFRDLRTTAADYYIVLQDDLRLCSDFFNRALAVWQGIEDPKISLTLSALSGRYEKPNWTNVVAEHLGDVWYTGWVDGFYLCERAFFEALEFEVYPVWRNWIQQPLLGSGVGAQLSRRLLAQEHQMFGVHRSLAYTTDAPSVMNPAEREIHTCHSIRHIDS